MPDPNFIDPKIAAQELVIALETFFEFPSRESWQALRTIVDALKPPPSKDERPAPYDERYEIRQSDVEKKLYELGHMIGDDLMPGWGFAVFLFSFGENGATFYISSAQRADVINLLKEYIAREEAKGGQS